MAKSILSTLSHSEQFKKLTENIPSAEKPFTISGVCGSLWALITAQLFKEFQQKIIVVSAERESAEIIRDDLATLVGSANVFFSSYEPKLATESFDMTGEISQIESLQKLISPNPIIIVTYIAAITTKVPAPDLIKSKMISIYRGSELQYENFISILTENGFTRKNFIETYGDFAVRGGIIDLFPITGEHPYRLEFWGDMVESIREFDIFSQRSIREVGEIFILPKFEPSSSTSTIFDYINNEAIIFYDDPIKLSKELDELQSEGIPTDLSMNDFLKLILQQKRIEHKIFNTSNVDINFSAISQPASHGSMKTLNHQLEECNRKGFEIWIYSETKEESTRLQELLNITDLVEENENSNEQLKKFINELHFVTGEFHEGFIYPNSNVALFTEHQIFGRIKQHKNPKRKRFKGISQKELHVLKGGDFVVHIDHGIGKYFGMKYISVGGNQQEVVKLEYANSGTLFVNVNFINRIQKYSSAEGHIPTLNTLGGKEWDRTKQRAKKKIKDIARDLIKLYALRKNSTGFAFSADTPWQKEMEASFMYDDTPDQATATLFVKQDMESSSPMDRLICGDVGFGKTEVAVRAAFKSVMSGKQVAVLVPTTILARQHGNTFLDRLGRYSTRIEVLSRFRSAKEIKNAIAQIAIGQVDIVIGTHRLLSKDINFKDLGLLIIDEEQRFGVSAKEKLRSLKNSVDTLTLTATPIPRTLQFSLMGSRDLSIISTPPRNRYPIHTEIAVFDKTIIREAIIREIHRGGQVYIVHDRISSIEQIVSMIQDFVPEARFCVAHGQMNAHKLEKVMIDFMERKYNVLVSTKIIESGIDIPSVNTIIINRADRFGMAELYQLRGRVGRSNIQAYAYLLIPPFASLSKETLRRLQAVEEFTELGSGFNLAMRDLEIRGAGNLLGSEQSGFVADMGFEMYQRLVNEAVAELKDEEFQEVNSDSSKKEIDAVVEVDVDAFISDEYVTDNSERLDLYRRIARTKNEKEIDLFYVELRDRFGELPIETNNLLIVARLRLLLSNIQLQKLIIRGDNATFYFPSKENVSFYEGGFFQKFIAVIPTLSHKLFFKEENKKSVLYGKIKSASNEERLQQIIFLLKDISDKIEL